MYPNYNYIHKCPHQHTVVIAVEREKGLRQLYSNECFYKVIFSHIPRPSESSQPAMMQMCEFVNQRLYNTVQWFKKKKKSAAQSCRDDLATPQGKSYVANGKLYSHLIVEYHIIKAHMHESAALSASALPGRQAHQAHNTSGNTEHTKSALSEHLNHNIPKGYYRIFTH